MKKTLVFSLFISFLLLVAINFYAESGSLDSIINEASLKSINGVHAEELMSFAFGNFLLYLTMAGAIYLFFRGVVKSFER